MKKRTKNNQKRINSLVLLIVFTAILLIVSTYAWFSTQRNVSLTDLKGKVTVAEGLQISLNAAPDSWSQEVSITDENINAANVSGKIANRVPSTLIPVSTDGSAANLGTTVKMYEGDLNGRKMATTTLVDEATEDKYYAFDMYLMNTNKTTTAGTNDLTLEMDGSNATSDADFGAQNAVRVGFGMVGTTKTLLDTDNKFTGIPAQDAVLTATTGKAITKLSIWEPNYDKHAQAIVNAASGKIKLPTTITAENYGSGTVADGKLSFTTAQGFNTYAVKAAGAVNDIYDWTDSNLAEQKTTSTLASENNKATTPKDLMDTGATQTKITIAKNAITRVRVYVWLEGQDVDSTNYASFSQALNINMKLSRSATDNT